MITRQHNETTLCELHNQTLDELLVSEYHHNGIKVSDASLVFVKFSESGWHRFYLDVGILFWQQVEAVDIEELVGIEGPDEFKSIDIATVNELRGKKLCSSEMSQTNYNGSSAGCLVMGFTGGKLVKFIHVHNEKSGHDFSEYTKLCVENA